MGLSSKNSEKNLRSNYASLNVNIDNVLNEVNALNGRIEELDYRINRELKDIGPLSKKVDEMAVSMAKSEQRIVQLEHYLNFDNTQKPSPVKPAGVVPVPTAQGSEKQIYDDAKKSYDNGEMDRARQGFLLLIQTYPKSENADNAQFWIGESYYREKWYEKAILEYQTVLEKYPKGNKVPAAMLKQGLAFLKLGDKSNARLILKELQKKHPKSNEARIASQKLSEF
jgi:tol-pal system protein YbgF